MKVVITGGAGFLGQRLAAAIDARGSLVGPTGELTEVDEIVLFDRIAPAASPSRLARSVVGDITNRDTVASVVDRPDCAVFHLASVVSHGAEQDFDLALHVNLQRGLNVMESCRALGSAPRLVFVSSFAAYGGDQPPGAVDDQTKLTPRSTYGTTKAALELLVNDYSRKGYIDGRTARLATVIIRPGRPNAAASSWCSSIFREPLAGEPCALPVPLDTRTALIGARTTIEGLVRLHELDASALGSDRALLFPALSATAEEMVATVERRAGPRTLGEIQIALDRDITALVHSWPTHLHAERAVGLGIPADRSLETIVAEYLEDETRAGASAR